MIEQAIILAAGKGTRMGKLTQDIPKPLLPLNGKPLLCHVLDRLQAAGIRRAAIVIGYHGEKIREQLADHSMAIEFIEQTEVNGTARAALLGRGFAGGESFVLTFGDILSAPEDYSRLMARLDAGTAGVLGVKWADDPYRGAAVYEDHGRVTRIIEKPPVGTSTTNWNSAGVYAFTPDLFPELERTPLSSRGEYELTSAITQLLEAGRLLKLCALEGLWLDVGRPEDLRHAEQLISEDRK